MEVKVGQWVRYGELGLFTQIGNELTKKLAQEYLNNGRPNFYVKNTPQELIQVGDLVGTKRNGTFEVTIRNLHMLKVEYKTYESEIIKIYTPDSDGNYIKQWEAK